MVARSGLAQSRLFKALVAIGIVCATALVAATAHQAIIYQRNTAQLNEMSRQLLSSAEVTVDYALISLGDVLAQGADPCSVDGLNLIQHAIFSRGSIKDIQVIGDGGAIQCSGMGGQFSKLFDQSYRGTPYPSINQSVTLEAASNEPTGVFKVVWTLGQAYSLAALLNVDTLMFDVFPADLRESSAASILLGDTDIVAQQLPDADAGESDRGVQTFSDMSDRFPLTVRLMVPMAKLWSWNADNLPIAAAFGGALGCLIAYLAIRALERPIDPARELRDALRAQQLQPYFQPIFSLQNGETIGCEVLTRWRRPDGTMVSPDRFIPLAEATGLIVPLTDFIIAESLKRLAPVLMSKPDFKIAFNVTPAHFMSEGFLEIMCKAVDLADVDHSHIVIELTERQAFVSSSDAAAQCRRAQALGFRVSLDDTGSGHNGLAHVQELPLNIIKIDKKFVDLVCTDQAAITIVEMLVRLAKALGASTVAEGVETAEQYEALRRCGVDEGQGYLVSPALPADRFLQFIDEAALAQDTTNDTPMALSA